MAALAAPLRAADATAEIEAAPIETAEAAGSSEGEILVTARRPYGSLQDVPLAVSVVGGAQLEATGAFNRNRLVQLQPSVQFISSNPRNTAINIRGNGAPFGLTNDGFEHDVGLYNDQVHSGHIAGSTLDLIDVDQVDILRGPQGTRYGKNATAGALNITTPRPSFDFPALREATYGNRDFIQGKTSGSAPIIADKLAARLSASFTKRDATLFNTISGRRVNEIDKLGIRGQNVWQATETLDMTLNGDRNRQDREGSAQAYVTAVTTLRGGYRTDNSWKIFGKVPF